MKIGFDAKRAFLNRSGLGTYSRSMISLLAVHYPMHEYFLFTPEARSDLYIPSSGQEIMVPRGKLYRKVPSLWRRMGISAEIRRNSLDLYHGLSNELPQGIRQSGAKSIVTIHDLIFLRYPELYPALDRITYKLKFRQACENADIIVSVSSATRDDIVEFFGTDPSKIAVGYQSFNEIFLENVPLEKQKEVQEKYGLPSAYLLSVGTLEERKNTLQILKAMQIGGIGLPLVLAGRKTQYTEELLKYARQHGMEEQVIIRENIITQDLPAIYRSAAVFIYPSLFEGFGIPILEAMASGVPVITSSGSCFAETGGSAAIYSDPRDAENLNAAILSVLNDGDRRLKMIREGYLQSEKFKGDKIAERMMKIYQQL